jgi:hypothetical protein
MDNRRDVKFPSRSGEGDVNMVTGVFVTHLFEYEDLADWQSCSCQPADDDLAVNGDAGVPKTKMPNVCDI